MEMYGKSMEIYWKIYGNAWKCIENLLENLQPPQQQQQQLQQQQQQQQQPQWQQWHGLAAAADRMAKKPVAAPRALAARPPRSR